MVIVEELEASPSQQKLDHFFPHTIGCSLPITDPYIKGQSIWCITEVYYKSDEWEGKGEKEKKKKERETKKTEGKKGKTASKNTIISSMTPQKSSHETRNYFTIMKQEFSGYLLPRPSSDGAKIHTNIISTSTCSTWPSPEPETISMGWILGKYFLSRKRITSFFKCIYVSGFSMAIRLAYLTHREYCIPKAATPCSKDENES